VANSRERAENLERREKKYQDGRITLSAATPAPPPLPTTRTYPLDPPEELRELRDREPVSPMTFADGHVGWLVTSHAVARAVLADPRFSSRQELLHPIIPGPAGREPSTPAEPGFFIRQDPPDHTRYRKLLAGQFTARRMKQLEPQIADFVERQLDELETLGEPVDLVEHFAFPVPSLVICELLGIPYAEREDFQREITVLLNVGTPKEKRDAAAIAAAMFVQSLVRKKRRNPSDDLLGGLAHTSDLNDDELTNIAFLLFGAGYETTANMIALGTYTLLLNPEKAARLRADPSLVENTVEELLRYLTILHIGPTRTALEDLELAGKPIKAGDNVALALGAANRDPARFDEPDRFDIDRSAAGHLAFGHGVHQCLGHQLARIELRIALPALFARFPGLRLACAADEVPLRHDMMFFGAHRLPVTW
jgi:cytochrome P450